MRELLIGVVLMGPIICLASLCAGAGSPTPVALVLYFFNLYWLGRLHGKEK